MRTSLRALAALLTYPTAEMLGALPELRQALAADAELAPAMPGLHRLLMDLANSDLLDLEEEHVALFERSRNLSLNLFEHVHGDSRERGPAMVELNGIYAEAGLEATSGELPDYLPMMLEYAAQEPQRGAELLGNAWPVLDLLHGRLAARRSAYAALLHAALLVAGRQPGTVPLSAEPEPTLAELDATWAEAPVEFGQAADPAAECGVDALAAKLRAATRTANPPPPRRTEFRRVAASQG